MMESFSQTLRNGASLASVEFQLIFHTRDSLAMKKRVDILFPEALIADENLRELLEAEEKPIYDAVYLELLVQDDENILPQIMFVMTQAFKAQGCLAVIGIYGVCFESLESCFLVDQESVWGVALGPEEVFLCTDGLQRMSDSWSETLKIVGQRLFEKLNSISNRTP